MEKMVAVRFERVAAVFDEGSRARLCDSSGSEHSPESLADLSDLVNSFLEKEIGEVDGDDFDEEREGDDEEGDQTESRFDELKNLFDDDDDRVKLTIYEEVEKAWRQVGDCSSPGFKRRLMSRLRERGLDAGLCKSKWEKSGRISSGNYEYIDINFAGGRYITEVNLAGEFKIARPTNGYKSLINIFPPIFVGEINNLKEIIKLMSNSIKKSMKKSKLEIPPWRRRSYMKAKWLGAFRRTTNEIPARSAVVSGEELAGGRSVGFLRSIKKEKISYYCREDFSSKVGMRVGNLTIALNSNILL